MDIMELGAIGELVGGVAVLVTLVYLVQQVRQGNTNARASSRQTLIDTMYQTAFEVGRDEELCRIIGEGTADFESLSDPDKSRYALLEMRWIGNLYNGVLLHEQGVLDAKTLDFIASLMASAISTKGGGEWWESTSHPPEVREYLAGYLERNRGKVRPYDEVAPYWMQSWGSKAAIKS